MQGWAERAGWLPTPLLAGVQMSKAAAQPVSQLLLWHLWKWCCFQKLCQLLVTSQEIDMQSDVLVPCF